MNTSPTIENKPDAGASTVFEKSAEPPQRPGLASSPLIVTLLVVLLVAVFVQGALLAALYLKKNPAGVSAEPSNTDTPGLVARADDSDDNTNTTSPAPLQSPLQSAPLGSSIMDDFFSDDWQPFAEMARMRERMDSLFEDSFSRFRTMPGFDENWLNMGSAFSADAAISEKDGNYVVTMDVPGADEATLDIKLENGVLSVAGDREEVNEESDASGNVIRQSQATSRFQQSFTLSGDVDATGMTSDYKDGVLTITIPKK